MLWQASVAFLIAVVSFGGASVLESRRIVRELRGNEDVESTFNCKCVYYYQCDDNNYVITSGVGIIDIRMNVPNNAKIQCPSSSFPNEIVCCKVKGSASSLKPLIKSPEEVIPVNQKENPTCGLQRTIINVRIFADDDDDSTPIDSEFPWIASIFKRTSSGVYKFQCSGSLIHSKVVLTANHCIHRKQSNKFVVVVNGKTKLAGPDSVLEDSRNVSEIVHHPQYNSGSLFNDAALLILDEAFVSTNQKRINTLCLPPRNVNLANTRCFVAGWGKDNKGQSDQNLRKVEVPFVDHSQCQARLRQTRLGHNFELDKSFMCAGGEEGRDACKGDGGSPLMCPMPEESDRFFQAGIVAWGIDCGLRNIPGVYADIQVLADWIRREVEDRHLRI